MSVLVVGLSHHTAPVSMLERAALVADAAAKLADDTIKSDHASEALVLSTCNRVEVYAEVDKFHGGVAAVSELLARHAQLTLDELTPYLYVHYEDRAVAHLFSVACGLDSMVVGESQILGQVKLALRTAQEGGTAGRVTNELAQHALRVGKRAHSETGIDEAGRSLVSIGLGLAGARLGGLAGRHALIVGAGSMSALAATTMLRAGVTEIVVANRTLAHGQRLAEQVGGRAIPLDAVEAALPAADLVVSCTGAVGLMLPREVVARSGQRRAAADPAQRVQFILDLALPHDVDPAVRELPGVEVADLPRLADAAHRSGQTADVEVVRRIVAEEVAAFTGWQRAVTVSPTVVALRSMAAEVVDGELTRLNGRLPDLEERARQEIALTVQRVVDKLLHAPTVRVKQFAEAPGGHAYADALRELFDLDPATAEALASPEIEGGP
jgi:glutamyl-tRNA reductase